MRDLLVDLGEKRGAKQQVKRKVVLTKFKLAG